MPVIITLQLQSYSAEQTFAAPFPVDSASLDGIQTLNIGSQSTGAGAGRVTFNPVTIARSCDSKSPTLWSRMCSGTPFQKARLTFTRDTEKAPYLAIGFSLVAVKTIRIEAGLSGDNAVSEVVSFEYGAVTFTAAVQNPDGSMGTVTSGWDRVKNVAQNTPIVPGA